MQRRWYRRRRPCPSCRRRRLCRSCLPCPVPLVPAVPVTLLLSSSHDNPIAAVVPTSENVNTRNCLRVISFFEFHWMASR